MQKPSVSTLIPILIIVSIITGGLYFLFRPQNDSIRQTTNSASPPQHKIEVTTKQQQDKKTKISTNSQKNLLNSNSYRRAPIAVTMTDPCLETIKQLDDFFLYLDTQAYIQSYQFPNGSKDVIANIINKALSHPPTPNDKKSILSQIKNGAHLYRTIGGQDLLILAKILVTEPDHLEKVSDHFYRWSLMAGQCPNHTYAIHPQLDQLYNYALFFIDSQDGKNYINRRDPMTGLLTRFYALQIIKEAQIHHIDQYNTNLASQITSLIIDIESSDLLERKATYLKTLYALMDE